MKKRTLISIVITIVCIALTNKFWFCIKPLQISFKAEGSGDTKFEFFLNKEDNNDFKKVKYGVIETNLDENDSVELFINRVHKAKRAKITVSAVSPPPPQLKNIILSEFELRYGKYKLDDLKAFSVEGAKLKIDGDRLIIYPESETVSLIYNKPVDLKSSTKFDIKFLIVIAVLSFLLSYKLTSYLADFKTLNNASRMDIVFLFIFFILLFIPISHIDTQSTKSEKENRTLAKYEPFIKDKTINFDYGNDFEKWFNDRFAGRFFVIQNYVNLKYRLALNYFEYTRYFINKKNNWIMDNIKLVEQINTPLNANDLDTMLKSIITFNNYCKKHNIKLYILVSPVKEYVYKEKNPYLLIKENNALIQSKEYFEKELKKQNITFILPVEEFRNRRNSEILFYKTDHHWTEAGAFLGYQILMKEIQKDFKDINVLDKNFFNYEYKKEVKYALLKYFYTPGISLEEMLINDKKITDTQYKYFKIPNSIQSEARVTPTRKYYETKYNDKDIQANNLNDYWANSHYKKGKYKAFLLGTSYTAAMTPYFQYTFKDLIQRRVNVLEGKGELSIRLYKKEIEKLKPDIIIICIDFTYIDRLKDLNKGVN